MGFSREQADGTAEALAETLTAEIATKGDLAELKTELKGDIAELRADMRNEFAAVRGEIAGDRADMRSGFAAVRGEFAVVWGEFASVRAELRGDIASLRTDTAKWILSAVFVNVLAMVGLAAAIRQLARN